MTILQSFFYLLLADVKLWGLRRLQARPLLVLPAGAVVLLVLQFHGVCLQVLPGLGALLPQSQDLLAFLVQLRHRLEDLRTEAFGDRYSVLLAVEAAVGEDGQEGEAGADVLLAVCLVVRVLLRHVELDGLNEVGNDLLNALSHRNGEAVLVEEIDYGHEKLTIVYFVLGSQGDHCVAMEDINDIWIIHVFGVEQFQSGASALPRRAISRALHLIEQRAVDQVSGLAVCRSVSSLDEAALNQFNECFGALRPDHLVTLVKEHLNDGDDNTLHRLGD